METTDYFPYESYRNQQEEVISQINKALQEKSNILLVAPNGTGKTVDNLAAALPIAIDKNLKIVYLCRTHQQSGRVILEIQKINKKLSDLAQEDQERPYVQISGVSLRGRSEMCLNRTIKKLKGSPSDIMKVCSDMRKNRTCNYFNNMIKHKARMTRDLDRLAKTSIEAQDIIQFCKSQNYCPYFFTKLMMSEVRVIVCNYQWIFNPKIRETFLEGAEIELDRSILIMDECHNLPDMAADVDSDRLTEYSIQQSHKDLEYGRATKKMISRVDVWQEILDIFKKQIKEEEKELDKKEVLKFYMKKANISSMTELKTFTKDLEEYGMAIYDEKISSGGNPIDFVGVVAEFMHKFISILEDPRYFFVGVPQKRTRGENTVHIEIVCLDPREITEYVYKSCYGTVSCSGTIHVESFVKLTGLDETGRNLEIIEIRSPFPKRHVKVAVTKGLNTRGSNRTPKMYNAMNNIISEVLFNTPGNVGIFCASYRVLRGLLDSGLKQIIKFSGKKFYSESSEFTASDNSEMIINYKSDAKKKGAVLLGVAGGRNSEGEDFPGDYMNAVVVVGFPYHRPTPRVEAKINYYNSIFTGKGWLFAYTIPAIQRSNQAAGRPIRKLDDKGTIILMDDRFITKKNLLSRWLQDNMEMAPKKKGALGKEIETFFQGHA